MTLDIDRVTQLRDCGQKVTQNILCFAQDKMTSPESTSDSLYDPAGVSLALATNDAAVDPRSTLQRHQTSLLGIDIAPAQTNNYSLAMPGQENALDHAATRCSHLSKFYD